MRMRLTVCKVRMHCYIATQLQDIVNRLHRAYAEVGVDVGYDGVI